MLKRIKVENFKSLKHLDYKCAKLNLLMGLNGAGKSSFVQLLRLMQGVSGSIGSPQTSVYPNMFGCGDSVDDMEYAYSDGSKPISFAVVFNGADNVTDFELRRVIVNDERIWAMPGAVCVQRPEWEEVYEQSQLPIVNLHSERSRGANVHDEEIAAAEKLAAETFASVENKWRMEDALSARNFGQMWLGGRFVDAFRDKPREVHAGGCYKTVAVLFGPNYISTFNPEGQNVMEYLYKVDGSRDLRLSDGSRGIREALDKCLQWVSPGAKLKIEEKLLGESEHYKHAYYVASLDYGARGDQRCFKPQNVGFGVSYILPVLTTLLSANPGNILIIENPEAHLHPRGQAEIGKLIAETVARGVQVFVETHSDHVINGIRVAVKKCIVKPEDVNIAFFERSPHNVVADDGATREEIYSEVRNIKVGADGSLSEYPTDFMDEWSIQQLRLFSGREV